MRILTAALFLFFVTVSPPSSGAGFLSVLDDVPLMAPLIENENAAVSFETATGRIAEAEARGDASSAAVRRFYAETLPQLGWADAGDGIFEREDERLAIRIEADGTGGAVVRFSLSPLARQ